jgi:hypothetical protein
VVIIGVKLILGLLYCVVVGNVTDVLEVHTVSIFMAEVCRFVNCRSYFPGTDLRRINSLVPNKNRFPPAVQELERRKNVRTCTHTQRQTVFQNHFLVFRGLGTSNLLTYGYRMPYVEDIHARLFSYM